MTKIENLSLRIFSFFSRIFLASMTTITVQNGCLRYNRVLSLAFLLLHNLSDCVHTCTIADPVVVQVGGVGLSS